MTLQEFKTLYAQVWDGKELAIGQVVPIKLAWPKKIPRSWRKKYARAQRKETA